MLVDVDIQIKRLEFWYKHEIDIEKIKEIDLLIKQRLITIEKRKVRRERKKEEERVHPTHKMSDWYGDPRCYCSTTRIYSVRHCIYCEYEQAKHPAGRFFDRQLKDYCKSRPVEEDNDKYYT